MRRSPIPFRFKVLRPDSGNELIYLPKLGEPDVEELVSRLKGVGFSEPEVLNVRPRILRFVGESSTLRLMPRGMLIGPRGTFERLGSALDIQLHHGPAGQLELSWTDNDYQSLAPSHGMLRLHVRGRHTPPPRRFSGEISKAGSALSADEAMMILATVEACSPRSVELFSGSPGASVDLSRPIRMEGKGFLHHVELSGEELLSAADEIIRRCLAGACPLSPLADSTVLLKGAALPSSSKGLEEVATILEGWVSDVSYLASPDGRQ